MTGKRNSKVAIQGNPEKKCSHSRPRRLTLENIAELYNRIENYDGLLNSTRCLVVIIRFLTSHRLRDIATWSKLFDPVGIQDLGWDKTMIKYFGSQKHVDGWFKWYKKKQFKQHQQVILDTDKKTILNKIMEERRAWFLDRRFSPITAAFVVKVYEASKRCKNQILPPFIYKKAKPVFLENWKFWCQRLVLDSRMFKHVCPNALEKDIGYNYAEIYKACFNDRNRYSLEESLTNNDKLMQMELGDLLTVADKSDTENFANTDAVENFVSTNLQVPTLEDDIALHPSRIDVSNQASWRSDFHTNNSAALKVIEPVQNKFQRFPIAEQGTDSVLTSTEYTRALEQDFNTLNQEHANNRLKVKRCAQTAEIQTNQLQRLLRMQNTQKLTMERFGYLANMLNNKSLASSMLLHFRQLLFTHAQNSSSIDIVAEIQNMTSGKQIV